MELSRARILGVVMIREPKPALFPPEVLHVVSYQRTQFIPCSEPGEGEAEEGLRKYISKENSLEHERGQGDENSVGEEK